MKTTLIRLILFLLLALLLFYVAKHPAWLLMAFIGTWIFEGLVTQLINRG